MEVRFQGTYGQKDVLAFDSALRKGFGLSSLYSVLILATIAAAAGIPLFIVALVRGDDESLLQWFLLGGSGAVIALRYWWIIARGVKKSPRFGLAVSGFLNDDGFQFETPVSVSKLTWDAIDSSLRMKEFLLLVGKTAETFGFSRTLFDSDQSFENACTLVASHVTGKLPAQAKGRILRGVVTWIVVIVFIILVWLLFRDAK